MPAFPLGFTPFGILGRGAVRASLRDQEILRVARIAGVNIPTNKRVVIALQYIHGIGPALAKQIVEKNNIDAALDAVKV